VVLWAPVISGEGRDLDRLGPACAALIVEARPTRGSSVPPLPCLAGVPGELLVDGDRAAVDGNAGSLELPAVKEVPVVTSFLEREDGRILLLRRSERVGSFQGRWAGVSGYLESEPPLAQALTEIREETGLAAERVELVCQGELLLSRDRERVYVVHPFRFRVQRPEIRLDWEHTELRWVAPSEIPTFPTVPRLEETWRRVAPTPPEPSASPLRGPKP
jgi:ADP-ribose pyrophosphatase YjhB (NUDIX family)